MKASLRLYLSPKYLPISCKPCKDNHAESNLGVVLVVSSERYVAGLDNRPRRHCLFNGLGSRAKLGFLVER